MKAVHDHTVTEDERLIIRAAARHARDNMREAMKVSRTERRMVRYRSRLQRWTVEQMADVVVLPAAWAANPPGSYIPRGHRRQGAE